MHTARVRYEYLVNEARHSGSSIGLLDHSSSSLREMSRLAERFPSGAEVAVYYDPRDPRTAPAVITGEGEAPIRKKRAAFRGPP